ncbi:Lysozyme [Mycena sanguinolenta]|uniref:Lysozyme n=1 Tax=Mycena sanguinolenta TaxID=230812 RepID=A0A8H6X877_9AGAR|nr:Lysozyme [Mycena sanguinolenta]
MRTSTFLVLGSVLLCPAVRTAPVRNSSMGGKCSENGVCDSQPSAPTNAATWSYNGPSDDIEGDSVDVPSNSTIFLAGGTDRSGADEASFDVGDKDTLDNFDFVGSGDVDIANNTDAVSACSPPANQATVDLVAMFHPFSAIAQNIRGISTIGFGHRCSLPNCADLRTQRISRAFALQLLKNDLSAAIRRVSTILSPNVRLTDNEIGALASLSYTVSLQELGKSALIRQLNAGGLRANMVEILWARVMGRGVNVRLVQTARRRNAEAGLFLTPSRIPAHPLPEQCQFPLQPTPLDAALL